MPGTTSIRSFRPLRRLARRIADCNRGVAAIEFGMIVPIMFMLFIGSVEFSQAITVDRRVTQVASSMADLVSRQTTVTSAQLLGYTGIINELLTPYPSVPLKMTVVSVYACPSANTTITTACPNPTYPATPTSFTVCWSYNGPNGGTTSYTNGGPYAGLPAGIISAGTSVIVAEVTYSYTPVLFHYFISTSLPMSEKFYLKPRLSNDVQLDSTKCLS